MSHNTRCDKTDSLEFVCILNNVRSVRIDFLAMSLLEVALNDTDYLIQFPDYFGMTQLLNESLVIH
jgi:hypothetical protein